MNSSKGFTTEGTENTEEIEHKVGRGAAGARDRGLVSWAQRTAMAGAAGWAVIALIARLEWVRIGVIELLFLFAPLVIVPLGMELQRMRGVRSGSLFGLAQMFQPLGAVMAAGAICLPPGWKAASFALGWFAVCAVAALSGVLDLAGRSAFRDRSGRGSAALAHIAFAIARVDLLVGGAWIVASRSGMHPMGIQEPIGLLTAVHFHFAGFATATIAGATLLFAQRHGELRWLQRVVWMVVLLPFVVAVGFVTSPGLKMGAAVLFSASVAMLAGFLWKRAGDIEAFEARVLLRIAASAILGGMVLSGAYAIATFVGSEALPIPLMASTHGVINALGFCMCGLLGWIVESSCVSHSSQRRA